MPLLAAPAAVHSFLAPCYTTVRMARSVTPCIDHWLAPTFHALSGAARALVADVPAAANGGAASGGCPPEVEAALDSAMPDEYGGPDELIVWASNQSYAGVSRQGSGNMDAC